jgi:hypothetical protein
MSRAAQFCALTDICRLSTLTVLDGLVNDSTPQTSDISIPADIVARRVGDTLVLVRLQSNRIYELNTTGARVWELLQQRASRDTIVETLSAEFEAAPDEIAAAYDALIAELRSEGLL